MLRRLQFLLIMASICLSLTITGCGLQDLLGKNKSKTTAKKANNQTIIAVSLNEDDPNKLLISKGIEDLAKKENAKVNYMDQASKEDSPLKGAKILIYQGGDPSILQKSQTEEVPVLALTQLPAGVKPEGIITPDQEKAGEFMAQALVSKVIEGQVVILQGDPNESGSQERLAGNKAILSKYPKISVHTIASTPGSESITRANLVDYLQKNPDKVQGILAHTEKLAVQASEVLKQAQLDKKISLVGGQANLTSFERMSSGAQMGDIDTSPYLQGVNAYQWAQKIIKKEPLEVNDSVTSAQGEIPAKVIPVKAVTPENIAIIQKSYAVTSKSAEQDKKQKEQADQKNQKDQSKGQAADKGSGGKDQGDAKKPEEASSEDKKTSIPSGVDKVTERVKTETTREYLDTQGKVIGTEKTVNEQVKTVPPEMIKQQTDQSKAKASNQGNQAKDQQKDQAK